MDHTLQIPRNCPNCLLLVTKGKTERREWRKYVSSRMMMSENNRFDSEDSAAFFN
jgi:hypothetical protein